MTLTAELSPLELALLGQSPRALTLEDVVAGKVARGETPRSVLGPQPLSFDQLRDVAAMNLADGLSVGRLRALHRHANESGRALLRRLIDVGERARPPAPTALPENPVRVEPSIAARMRHARAVEGRAVVRDGEWAREDPDVAPAQPLTPAELLWIQRLPARPADFTGEQIRDLVGLVDRSPDDGDQRLLRQVLEPVRAHHARIVRRAELQQAADEPLVVPAAHNGGDLLRAQLRAAAEQVTRSATTDLTDDEVDRRAEAMTVEALAACGEHARLHGLRTAAARARLAELERGGA